MAVGQTQNAHQMRLAWMASAKTLAEYLMVLVEAMHSVRQSLTDLCASARLAGQEILTLSASLVSLEEHFCPLQQL